MILKGKRSPNYLLKRDKLWEQSTELIFINAATNTIQHGALLQKNILKKEISIVCL